MAERLRQTLLGGLLYWIVHPYFSPLVALAAKRSLLLTLGSTDRQIFNSKRLPPLSPTAHLIQPSLRKLSH
eukprot:251901-Chlamydomonas_euryale.AAC.1